MQKIVKFFILSLILTATPAYAQEVLGYALPWEFKLLPAASPVKETIHHMHNFLMYVITIITIFVTILLAYTCIRFRAKANPVPSKTSHNTLIEVLWTIIPVIILVAIAIPSFKTLFEEGRIEKADMTLKVVGHQWYWSYEYPDQDNIKFDSYMIADKDLKPGDLRLLTVDNRVVVPVNKVVRVQVTGADVIHSWAVPSLGVKKDAVPGRLNETWFKVTKPGIYYGQCSELCGQLHGFMPIMVEAVTQEDFDKWVQAAKQKFS